MKHTYARAGKYTVQLNGNVNGFAFGKHGNDDDDDIDGHPFSKQIIDMSQWGCVRLANKGSHFNRCTYLKVSAKDVLDLTGHGVTCMELMFYGASSFNGDVSQWNTGNMTDTYARYTCSGFIVHLNPLLPLHVNQRDLILQHRACNLIPFNVRLSVENKLNKEAVKATRVYSVVRSVLCLQSLWLSTLQSQTNRVCVRSASLMAFIKICACFI